MIILITGGVSCGKSSFAEKCLLQMPSPHYYIATMKRLDEESDIKIGKHVKRRESTDIIVFEKETYIDSLNFSQKGSVLLECLTTLTTNEMFGTENSIDNVFDKVFSSVKVLAEKSENLIIVTNEVGCGYSTEYSELTENYINLLGRLNCAIAEISDCVIDMHCGIPTCIKGTITNA